MIAFGAKKNFNVYIFYKLQQTWKLYHSATFETY
jgi:hypothetical protein